MNRLRQWWLNTVKSIDTTDSDGSANRTDRTGIVADKHFRKRCIAALAAGALIAPLAACSSTSGADSAVTSIPVDSTIVTTQATAQPAMQSVAQSTAQTAPQAAQGSDAQPIAQTVEAQSTTTTSIKDASEYEGKPATDVLATLETKGRAPKTGYSRSQFGPAWSDVDRNGCDTRNDILNRDLTDKTYKSYTHECVVKTGTLADPYTGKTINFTRGNKTSKAVQIDHVVALSDAWQKGAQQLTATERKQLANDPYNLLAVDGPANQQKSDGDAATWLPKNKSYRCDYVARQIGVKAKYSLWVTTAEREAMTKVLSACPTQTVPLNDEAQEQAEAAKAAEEAQRKAEEEAQRQAEEQAQQQAQQQQAQQQQQDSNVYYKNCTAVRAAGKAPLYRGQPGYNNKLDRDSDGVAYE